MNVLPLDWFKYLFGDAPVLPVVITICVLIFLGVVLYRIWPVMKRFVGIGAALERLPDFMDKTTATLRKQDESLAAQDVKIEEIHHEVNFNNGSSVKDAIIRVEGVMTDIRAVATNQQTQIDTKTTRRPPRIIKSKEQ